MKRQHDYWKISVNGDRKEKRRAGNSRIICKVLEDRGFRKGSGAVARFCASIMITVLLTVFSVSATGTGVKYKKGDTIPVFINGAEIKLGEMTLQEVSDLTGFTVELQVKEKDEEDSDQLKWLKLVTGDEEKKVFVGVDSRENNDEDELWESAVRGVCINCFNGRGNIELIHNGYELARTELVTIGGICAGESGDFVEEVFGVPYGSGSFFDGFRYYREYAFRNYELEFTSTQGIVDYISIILTDSDVVVPDEIEGKITGETEGLRKEVQELRSSNELKWEESDSIKECAYCDITVTVPQKLQIFEGAGEDEDALLCKSERDQFNLWVSGTPLYGQSSSKEMHEEQLSEEEIFIRMMYILRNYNTRRIEVEFERGSFLGCPAYWFYGRHVKDDGSIRDEVGVVFATVHYIHKLYYYAQVDDENAKSMGEKIINSVTINANYVEE